MFELFFLPFFQRALLVGLILGSIMAALGVLVVLRRMAFFSDAIGHAALTGIAIGLLLHINPFISALVFSLLVATGISAIRRKSPLPLDTLLGVFFSASVALGIILIQRSPGYQADLISFLFGDILTVSQLDIYLSLVVSAVAGIITLVAGKKFVTIALDPALAQAEGIPVATYELIFLLILAGIIALSIKLIGVILVTALLIIPAASAHNVARSLATMFIISIALGLTSVLLGMILSVLFNTASGPTIVLTSTLFFTASLFLRPLITSAS